MDGRMAIPIMKTIWAIHSKVGFQDISGFTMIFVIERCNSEPIETTG